MSAFLRIAILILIGTLPARACGQSASSSSAAKSEPKPVKSAADVSRVDLALAYLRFDRAFTSAPPHGEPLARIGAQFDGATMAFFGGKFDAALRTINELMLGLRCTQGPPSDDLCAASLRVTIDPPVWVVGSGTVPVARVQSLYAPAEGVTPPSELKLRLISTTRTHEVSLPWPADALPDKPSEIPLVEASGAAWLAEPDSYEVFVTAGSDLYVGRWHVVPKSLDTVRGKNSVLLAALQIDAPTSLQESVAICQARNELLTDRPSEKASAQFLAMPLALVTELEQEIASLEAGRDPYHRRQGDYWRVLLPGNQPTVEKAADDGAAETNPNKSNPSAPIPVRIYAPAAVCGDEAVPLVVVLHGAGGDENMFLDAYGTGVIKRLADEHRFLVASPSTYGFGAKPENLTALLDSLSVRYSIDPQRIYMLGHSMGAGATATLARTAADRIAAACCLAGGGSFPADEATAPTLIIAAENDGVIRAASLEKSAKAAIEKGLPIEYRLAKDHGHTTIVGALVPEGVEWLLGHRRGM